MENCKHGLQEQKQGEQVLRKSAGKRSLWLETKERVLVSWGMTGSTNERKTKRKKAFHSRYFHMIKMQLDSLRWPTSFRLFNIIPNHLLLRVSYLVLSFCVIMSLVYLEFLHVWLWQIPYLHKSRNRVNHEIMKSSLLCSVQYCILRDCGFVLILCVVFTACRMESQIPLSLSSPKTPDVVKRASKPETEDAQSWHNHQQDL